MQLEGQTLAVKMDVEGFEMETLKGGERLFRRNSGYAQIEAYDGRDAQVIPRMAELGWRLDRTGSTSTSCSRSRDSRPLSSCPGLSRASTTLTAAGASKTWMAMEVGLARLRD